MGGGRSIQCDRIVVVVVSEHGDETGVAAIAAVEVLEVRWFDVRLD